MDSSNPAAAGGESEKLLAEAVLFSGRLFDLNGESDQNREENPVYR